MNNNKCVPASFISLHKQMVQSIANIQLTDFTLFDITQALLSASLTAFYKKLIYIHNQ